MGIPAVRWEGENMVAVLCRMLCVALTKSIAVKKVIPVLTVLAAPITSTPCSRSYKEGHTSPMFDNVWSGFLCCLNELYIVTDYP